MATAIQQIQQAANGMSLDQIQTTRRWNSLTPKQRMWVQSYIGSNGDARFATKTAYNSTSEQNAASLSYEIESNPKVRAVLDLYYDGLSDQEIYMAELEKTIRTESGIAKTNALRLYAELQGWTKRSRGTEPISIDCGEVTAPEVPEGSRLWKDESGNVIGYRDASGKDVRL